MGTRHVSTETFSPYVNIDETDSSRLPYLARVKTLANAHKNLRHLADWMEVGTTPLRWKELKTRPKQREERLHRTNITVFNYLSSRDIARRDLHSSKDLADVLSSPYPSEKSKLRLFLVEDLSQQVIEQLGTRFAVDPLFFREQIADYTWYNTRDPWANSPSLLTTIKNRNWFSLRNVRLRYYHSKESFENARHESNNFNVLRRPDNDENHWHYLDKPNSIVSVTRTKTSVWIGSDPTCKDVQIAIVLIDPTISEGQTLWYGPTNWLLPLDSPEIEAVPKALPVALFERLVTSISQYPYLPLQANKAFTSFEMISHPTIYTICAEWLMVCDYLKTRLGQIEWELEKPARFRSKGDIIDSSLRRLHVWRRLVPVFRQMITETVEQALPTVVQLSCSVGGSGSLSDDITPELTRVRNALDEVQARVDRLTSVVTSEISIEDSRRALEENHNLARLTWLATIFLPLSFVTGIFSMQPDISELRTTFGWYFLTAIPWTIIVLIVAVGLGKGWFRKTKVKAP